MSPDKRGKPLKKRRGAPPPDVPVRPSPADPHEVLFLRRHRADDPSESIPGREFLRTAPIKVRAQMNAVLTAVAKAPPSRFSGGGKWEAMHGEMSGWFEVRVDGPQKKVHYRLFCLLDYDAVGRETPLLVVVTGLAKPIGTTFDDSEYEKVRELGREYLARNPRSLA